LIRFLRNILKPFFQLFTLVLQYLPVGVVGHPDGIAPDKNPAAERTRNQKAIPGLKDFFLEALKAKGKIGNPVSFASSTTPG
jgi:hypothetical protein